MRRRIDLADDIATLDALTDRIGDVRLVIIDPLSAYVGRIDVGRQSVVRERLQPVAEFAARRGVAVVAVAHLNKTGRDAMIRVAGSLAFVAATRAPCTRARSAPATSKPRPDRVGDLILGREHQDAAARGQTFARRQRPSLDTAAARNVATCDFPTPG